MNSINLETERLVLRAVVPGDAEPYYRIYSNPENVQFWFEPAWTSFDQAIGRVEYLQKRASETPDIPLSIIEKSSNLVIGNCCLFAFFPSCRRAEVGYSLDKPFWGKGIATEAVGALLKHGFETLNLNRIEADIDPNNLASERLLLKLGFQLEGYLRERWIVGDVVSDTKLFGLLASDWNKKNS